MMQVTVDPNEAAKIESFMQKASAAGYSEDEIKQAVQKRYGNEQSTKQPIDPMRGTTGSFGAGASGSWDAQTGADRFKRGFMQDPLSGLKQLGAETEIAGFVAPEWAKQTREGLQQKEADYQQERSASGDSGIDWMRILGQATNPVNLGIAALTKTPPGASLMQRTASGALGGGMMSAAAPVYGDATRAEQTTAGTIGGAVAAPVAAGLARMVKPAVDPLVKALRGDKITPSFGQMIGPKAAAFEDRLTSVPLVGDLIKGARSASLDDLNLAVYNRALAPIGVKHSGKLGQAGVAEVRQTLSDEYNKVLKNVMLKPDQQFTQDFTNLTNTAGGMMEPERRIWQTLVDRLNQRTKQGTMDGDTLKSIHTTMDDTVDKLRRDGSFEKAELADLIEDLKSTLNDTLKRSNPMYAKQLNKLDEGWANYAILRDAAYDASKRQGSGMVTPSDLTRAVARSGERSRSKAAAKGAFTEGDALMQDLSDPALRVLPSTYPDSGTTGRALLAALLAGAPMASPGAVVPAALGAAATLPYLPGARKVAAALLTGRQGPIPSFVSDAIKYNPALLAPVAPAIVNSTNSGK